MASLNDRALQNVLKDASESLTKMVAEKFVALEVWIIEGIFAEEDPRVAPGHDEAPQRHYQGVLQPLVGDTFKSLHDTSVPTVPRETKHHHCGNVWIEIISCGNKGVIRKFNIRCSERRLHRRADSFLSTASRQTPGDRLTNCRPLIWCQRRRQCCSAKCYRYFVQ